MRLDRALIQALRSRRTRAATGSLAALLALLAAAAPAGASWSTPTILFQDAGASLFTAAGDPSGRAFLISGGSAPDIPLVLTERLPSLDGSPLAWGPGRPVDGSVLPFASSGRGRAALRGAAAGAG